MPTMKIPGIGPVEKKWVYVGGALIAGIVGYAYWARSSASNAEVDEEEPVYETETPVDDYVPPGSSTGTVDEDNNPTPTTNAQWSWAVFEKLTDNGYAPGKVSAALAKYFARARLSQNQGAIIRAAHAFFGPPPVGDYPINIHKDEPDGPDKPDPEKPDKPSVYLPGSKLKKVYSVKVRDRDQTSIGLDWSAVAGATRYNIYLTNGRQVGSSHDTHGRAGSLSPNHSYNIVVAAIGSDGKPGPKSGYVTAKTTKTVQNRK